jgi:hypothetical protein
VVAYLILSYTGAVERLVATLRAGSPRAIIAVHHDPRLRALGDVDALRLGPWPIEWGHGSQLAAILRALRALRERAAFDWVVLLSGQDYPVRPVADIEARLRDADADAFIQHQPVSGDGEFALRYRHRWRPAGERKARLAARAGLAARRLPAGWFIGLPAEPPLPLYHGSDWFTLSRRAVDALLEAPPAVVDHFLHTIVPTEAFAHTVLANANLRLVDDNHRHFRFDGAAANPRVLTTGDLDAVLASGADFARKFDDPAVLDELDRRLTSAPR